MKSVFLKNAVGALAFLVAPGMANATLIYDSWSTNEGDTGNYIVTVNDLFNGFFNVNITIDPWNAEALGIFIDLGEADIVDNSMINETPAGEVSVFATDTTSNNCGDGCNLNGLNPPLADPDGDWEWVLRLADSGLDGIQTFSFDIATNGYTESDWGLVGMRSQSLCSGSDVLPDGDNCGGSDKSYGSSTPTRIPEPSSLALLGIGVVAIGAVRRRRRASA